MKSKLLGVLVFLLLLGITVNLFAQSDASKKTIGNENKIEEWKDARFGMFIHWGPVTLKGTEIGWSRGNEIPVEEYDNLYKRFNPVKFNADEWVSVAKAAGMKYIVLTAKHHDGFCLWNTRQTDHNIMNSPFGRDVVKELSEACRKQGIAFGAYYSTCDWYNPDFPLTSPGGNKERPTSNLDAYTTYLKKQVAELLLNYGPLYELWFDVPQKFDKVRGQGVIDFAHQIQPDIIINSRTGAKGDFDNPEQRIGGFQNDRPWETCMTIADQWAWKPNDKVKSLEQCLHGLIRTVGGDGNFLFNVGPNSEGVIEPLQVERLKQMGDWMKLYGSTVYGTRGGPFKPTDWGVSTFKGNKIYLHLLKWFGDSPKLMLPDFGLDILNCKLFGGEKLKFTHQNGTYSIEVPKNSIKPIDTIVELEVSGDAATVKAIDPLACSLSYQKKVTASSNQKVTWNSNVQWVNNGDLIGFGWLADQEDKAPWLEFDLGKPIKISKAILFENGNSIKSFELQYKSGDKWVRFYKGTTIGESSEMNFNKVTAQQVRVVFKSFTAAVAIREIILL